MGAATSLAATGLNAAIQLEQTRRKDSAIKRSRRQGEADIARDLQVARASDAEKLRRDKAKLRASAAKRGVSGSQSAQAVLRGADADARERDRLRREEAAINLSRLRTGSNVKRVDNLLTFSSEKLGGFSSAKEKQPSGSGARSLFE